MKKREEDESEWERERTGSASEPMPNREGNTGSDLYGMSICLLYCTCTVVQLV